MKITGIRYVRLHGTLDYAGPLREERLIRPVDIYREFRQEGPAWPIREIAGGPPYPLTWQYLLIDTDADITGIWSPISDTECYLIEHSLKSVLIGEDPRATERIWDKLYRHSIHGRKGLTMMAISAIDLALWDIKGKLHGVPVHELIGGPSRSEIRAYASMLGYSIEPSLARERANEMVAAGYTATKWFFRDGPTDGPEGLRRNLALIEAVRDGAGPDTEIMFDAWNSWDVPYTRRMATLAADCRPWWFEEPVLADRISEYSELARTLDNVSIAGGEHEYTRWGIKALLDARAVDVLQADPTWAGGLTEMLKICALASANGIPVIPHHGGIASSQLIASQALTTCPLQEWLVQYGIVSQHFMQYKIQPKDGAIALPDVPGMGTDIDMDTVERWEDLAF